MTGRVVAGVALVAVGLLFLLGSLDVIEDPGRILGSWWPSVFLLIGVLLAIEQRRIGYGPLLFGTVGVVLLMTTTDLVDARMVWPVALIMVGGWLLLRPRGIPGRTRIEDAVVELTSVFGDRHTRGGAGPLERASLTSLFGDVEVDLSDTRPGDDMAADIAVLFGDVDLTIPADWRVALSPTSLFGDVKHLGAAKAPSGEAPLLRVRGFTLFGDITVHQ